MISVKVKSATISLRLTNSQSKILKEYKNYRAVLAVTSGSYRDWLSFLGGEKNSVKENLLADFRRDLCHEILSVYVLFGCYIHYPRSAFNQLKWLPIFSKFTYTHLILRLQAHKSHFHSLKRSFLLHFRRITAT